ncbi:MAG: hypothetical protein QXW13_02195, partial [Nanopusillaceae archaeon]
MKKSLLIGTLFLKVLFDIVILIIIIVLIAYAISSIASLGIIEDRTYIKLLNFIEETMAKCLNRGICEEKIWIEEFYYNPIKYDLYFNFSDMRIYLIRCDEPEGEMYFEASGGELYRVFSQNCKILKRSSPILTNDTKIIIENKNKNISVYNLKVEKKQIGRGRNKCLIKIKERKKEFVINISTIRKSIGSFLFGESSKVSSGKIIKEFDKSKCDNEIYDLKSKSDLVEKGLLTTVPLSVLVNSSK